MLAAVGPAAALSVRRRTGGGGGSFRTTAGAASRMLSPCSRRPAACKGHAVGCCSRWWFGAAVGIMDEAEADESAREWRGGRGRDSGKRGDCEMGASAQFAVRSVESWKMLQLQVAGGAPSSRRWSLHSSTRLRKLWQPKRPSRSFLHMHTCPPRQTTTKLAGSGIKLEAFLLLAFPGVPLKRSPRNLNIRRTPRPAGRGACSTQSPRSSRFVSVALFAKSWLGYR
jgi:hypothetical protein